MRRLEFFTHLVLGNVLSSTANDDTELAFVVELVVLGDKGADSNGARSGEGRLGLVEEHGELRDRQLGLGGVSTVAIQDLDSF
jgi:hypothetical protein